MIIKVLASGSKGNSTLVITEESKILIDDGISLKKLEESIKPYQVKELDAVIITHEHSDHVKGLPQLQKKYHINIYDKENIDTIALKDISIIALSLSHDVPCMGLIIKNQDKELVYITDTGYLSSRVLSKIKNKDMYIIESNHDEQMLLEGNYPLSLKKRILDDEGHLSNKSSAKYMKDLIGDKTKFIVLAHLSENNNTKDLAYNTMKETICNQAIKIIVAEQDTPLEELKI